MSTALVDLEPPVNTTAPHTPRHRADAAARPADGPAVRGGVVIPAHDEEQALPATVASLAAPPRRPARGHPRMCVARPSGQPGPRWAAWALRVV